MSVLVWGRGAACQCIAYTASESTYVTSAVVYDVTSTGGYHYLFRSNPDLRPGEPFVAVFGGDGHYRYAIVYGRRFPSTSTRVLPGGVSTGSRISSGLMVAFFLLLGGMFVAVGNAGRRLRRAIDRDEAAPLERMEGRYEGSSLSRALTMTAQTRLDARLAGFPVFITPETGATRWFSAPLDRAAEVKEFETAIRPSERWVEAVFHPNTRVLVSLRSRGGSEVKLDRTNRVDLSTVGLPLKKWRGRVR